MLTTADLFEDKKDTMAISPMQTKPRGKAIGSLLGVATLMVSASIFAPTVQAQELQSVPDAVESVYQNRTHNFFHNRSVASQLGFITGWGGFRDQRNHQDAAALEATMEELLILQTQNTATVRVPDLPNPYSTSVQLLPTSQFNSRIVGSELNFEPLPRR